jgi:hypothetical protein
MANGFASCHPATVATLKQLGVTDDQVTQGVGYAAASAGFHEPVGMYNGLHYGTCVDLTHALCSPDFLQRCWQAGLIAFDRSGATGWNGTSHIHAVHIGLRDDNGACRIFDGPRHQIVDFLHAPPLNGLAGHGLLEGFLPTADLQASDRVIYSSWVPDEPTAVYDNGTRVPCYAWYNGQTVTCDVRALCEALNCQVSGDQNGVQILSGGLPVDIHAANPHFDGRWWRAGVRGVAEALGYAVTFTPLSGVQARVDLTK